MSNSIRPLSPLSSVLLSPSQNPNASHPDIFLSFEILAPLSSPPTPLSYLIEKDLDDSEDDLNGAEDDSNRAEDDSDNKGNEGKDVGTSTNTQQITGQNLSVADKT